MQRSQQHKKSTENHFQLLIKPKKSGSAKLGNLTNATPSNQEEYQNMKDKKNPYGTSNEIINFLNVFSTMLTLTTALKCSICKRLMIDCTVLNCGDAFCKFCLTSWLRLMDTCPICQRTDVKPMCNRCYELDSFTQTMHPFILEILLPNVQNATTITPTLSSYYLEIPLRFETDVTLLQKQLDSPQKVILKSKEDEIVIRDARRRLLSQGTCVLRSCPSRSMLDGIIDLGFLLQNSIFGFILVLIGCACLAMSVFHANEALDMLGLTGIRHFAHVLLIVYILCTHTAFLRLFGARTREEVFWRQIVRVETVEERFESFKSEKYKLLTLISKKEINIKKLQIQVMSLLMKLKKNT